MADAFHFDEDWVSWKADDWRRWLAPFTGRRGVRALEIGTWQGRSARWLLDHVLTGPGSTLVTIDRNLERFAPNAGAFARAYGDRFRAVEERADRFLLREIAAYDFIYLDGPKDAGDVLLLLSLCWLRLKRGGVLFVDDFGWPDGLPHRSEQPPSYYANPPRLAIDAFCLALRSQMEELHRGWQVTVRKK